MRTLLKPLVLGVCLLGVGCSFVANTRRNIFQEPQLALDERATKRRNHKLGKQAWNEMIKQYGESFSCDYRSGFVDGFEDYMTYGGCMGSGGCCSSESCGGGAGAAGSCATGSCATGSCGRGGHSGGGCGPEYPVCPSVPPERYRRKRYMTPEGCQAIEDWYMGFRHGAATAQASGLRAVNVIPVQCPPAFGPDDSCQPPAVNQPPKPKKTDETPQMPPPGEPLPEPRPAGETPSTPATGGTLPEPRPEGGPKPGAAPPAPPTEPKKP